MTHNPMWDCEAQCAFPSATQNEINGVDATNMLKNKVYVVAEGKAQSALWFHSGL